MEIMKKINDEAIMQKTGEVLSKEYARRLVPDESGGYVASIHEFPGCIAEGNTADEAITNLDAAAASWVKVALSNGYEIREPVSFHGYSGKIALRIPRGLHKQVAELAELEETSINQLLVTAISQYVSGKTFYIEMREAISNELKSSAFAATVNIFAGLSAIAMKDLPRTFVLSSPVTPKLEEKDMSTGISPVHYQHFNFEPNRLGTVIR